MIALLRAIAGLIVWAVVFSLLYAIEGLGCAGGWDNGVLRTVLVAIWIASVAGLGWLSWRWWPRAGMKMLDWLAGAVAIIGLVSTIWTGFPVAVLSTCI